MKTLLVTDVPACRSYSSGLLTSRLAASLPAGSLDSIYIVSEEIGDKKSEIDPRIETSALYWRKRRESRFIKSWMPDRLSFLVSHLHERWRRHWLCRQLAKKVMARAKENGAENIWIILQGQTMIWLAERLIRKSRIPICAQFWDEPSWWGRANLLDKLSRRMLNRSFKYCLKNATIVGTPSHNATRLLEKTVRNRSIPLLGPADKIENFHPLADGDTIRIAVAGQLYATDTIAILIDTLSQVNFKIAGRKVEIHHWGSPYYPEAFRPFLVEHGSIDQAQLLVELGKCDLLYCPYWFQKEFRDICITSFPSKIVSYMASGRPVLFHGPEESAPVRFLESSGAIEICTTIDAEILRYHIRKLVLDKDYTAGLCQRAYAILHGELGAKKLEHNFQEFLRA